MNPRDQTITVNGQDRVLPAEATVAGLLADMGLAGRRVAVERNQAIVPRSQHAHTRVEPGDRIEIVHAIGGG